MKTTDATAPEYCGHGINKINICSDCLHEKYAPVLSEIHKEPNTIDPFSFKRKDVAGWHRYEAKRLHELAEAHQKIADSLLNNDHPAIP